MLLLAPFCEAISGFTKLLNICMYNVYIAICQAMEENIYQINSIINLNKIDVMVFDLFYLKPSHHIL